MLFLLALRLGFGMLALLAGRAAAQVDCGAGGSECEITRYGLGLTPDYRSDEVPPDPSRYSPGFFGPDFGGQSYFVSRVSLGVTTGTCGLEERLGPLPGQILLRERTDCAPTSPGPICSAGANAGAACHLPTLNQGCTGAGSPLGCCSAAGVGTCSGFQTSAANFHECGSGGVCTLGAGEGCRVEIVLGDGGVTPAAETSEVRFSSYVHRAAAPNGSIYSLSSSSGYTLGGTSFDGISPVTGSQCTVSSTVLRRVSAAGPAWARATCFRPTAAERRDLHPFRQQRRARGGELHGSVHELPDPYG